MKKQNILVVDDRRENLIAMEALLDADDRNLVMAQTGNEALALALKHDFALVLLDVQMPDMDGFEVATLMRRNRKTRHLPIIFVTALSKEGKYVSQGYRNGAVDYLFKPVDEQILDAKVNVFLELDRQRRKLEQAVVQMKRLKDENERLLHALGDAVIGVDAGPISMAWILLFYQRFGHFAVPIVIAEHPDTGLFPYVPQFHQVVKLPCFAAGVLVDREVFRQPDDSTVQGIGILFRDLLRRFVVQAHGE